ncbi:MAG TPA: type I 3-dehydroquinate dehydratase [Chthoniobacterales bacterium]|nr:type I 3-dehydroquinate dehydratase [Chthoniobacterales bacterium]
MTKSATPKIVGVIFSRADFERALRMRNPPDLFELRLDAFGAGAGAIRSRVEKLGAGIILTARHPREGGASQLSSRKRREFLLTFLPAAAWVDIELRSAGPLAAVFQAARKGSVRTILSFHDFRGTPSATRLEELARQAESLGPDIIKIATRTDTMAQLDRLLEFFERQRPAGRVVAMGIGKLGRKSRLELARRGCALNYAHLGAPRIAGQLSIPELRRALR